MEDKKYPIGGYAPGNYTCKCCICGNTFRGDKRAVQCEPCAIECALGKTPPDASIITTKQPNSTKE